MVELRKRNNPPSDAVPPPQKKVASAVASVAKNGEKPHTKSPTSNATSRKKLEAGDIIELEGFGGEIETNDGKKTTLKSLVDESKDGVVIFSYPKASTPGCTTQACLFRDEYTPLTATGYSIFGISNDSPKSNTTFKTKHNMPFTLLCDSAASLIGAIGLKKAPKGTTRGVFVVSKAGKIEALEPGGPGATVEVVRNLVKGKGITQDTDTESAVQRQSAQAENDTGQSAAMEIKGTDNDSSDKAKAEVAAEVADSAEKLDEGKRI